MATVNLGRIKPVFKSTWANGTTYAVDDFVVHGNECYICIQAGAGQNPTSASSYWTKIAAKGTNGTDLTSTLTTQGDILYRDGSGLQRLPKGTAGQVLKMNSGATAPEYGTAPSGKILNVYYKNLTSTITGGSTYTWHDVTNLTQTLTPVSVDSKFLIHYRVSMGTDGNHTYAKMVCGGTSPYLSDAYGSNFRSASVVSAKTTWDLDELTGTYLWDANTASSTTIKIQYAFEGSGYVNRSERDNGGQSDARATSDMTIYELNN